MRVLFCSCGNEYVLWQASRQLPQSGELSRRDSCNRFEAVAAEEDHSHQEDSILDEKASCFNDAAVTLFVLTRVCADDGG
jgi:hypothetical protein